MKIKIQNMFPILQSALWCCHLQMMSSCLDICRGGNANTHSHNAHGKQNNNTGDIFFSVLFISLDSTSVSLWEGAALAKKQPLRVTCIKCESHEAVRRRRRRRWGRRECWAVQKCFVPFQKPAEGDARSCQVPRHRQLGWFQQGKLWVLGTARWHVHLSVGVILGGNIQNVDGRQKMLRSLCGSPSNSCFVWPKRCNRVEHRKAQRRSFIWPI